MSGGYDARAHRPAGSFGAGVILTRGRRGIYNRRGPDVAEPMTWSVFGGRNEEGETPILTAIRELREESGVAASPADLTFVDVVEDPATPGFRFWVYLAPCPEGVEPTLSARSHEWGEFPFGDRAETVFGALPADLHGGMARLVQTTAARQAVLEALRAAEASRRMKLWVARAVTADEEALARRIAARKMGLVRDRTGTDLPNDLWMQAMAEAREELARGAPAGTVHVVAARGAGGTARSIADVVEGGMHLVRADAALHLASIRAESPEFASGYGLFEASLTIGRAVPEDVATGTDGAPRPKRSADTGRRGADWTERRLREFVVAAQAVLLNMPEDDRATHHLRKLAETTSAALSHEGRPSEDAEAATSEHGPSNDGVEVGPKKDADGERT